ncbi:class I SAM-dependent methyltransferase [Rhodomicrobium lacus]|uniref:class I SAM-dependent methyltransferase n=1 Tax=Rhodomicrobium lacus TaxID=2498452 RepID=UPI0026E3CD47|nr:methyltransferase domain-containing protein [Rhodomicrobium lacus]WKW50272.1 methyltransferase domain-containing protein [Rhodomicrobium lacus]
MDFTGERYVPGIGGSIALEHEHRYRFCLDIVEGQRVLDIACGEGYGSALLASRAEKVWGVDIDRQAVDHANQTYKRDNLRFFFGSCSAIPLPDASVDVIVSFETIEHHDEHEEMIKEIRRLLRPGGALIISSPDKRFYSDERKFRNEFHVKELYREEFISLLKANFANVTEFGQRIAYGSALLLREGAGEIRSYGIACADPVNGLHNPIYQLAIASDDPAWAALGRGGIMEETVYRSEAIIERTLDAERTISKQRLELDELKEAAEEQVRELRLELDKAKEAAEEQVGELRLELNKVKLAAEEQVSELRLEFEQLRRNRRVGATFRRLVFHRSGKPRGWMRTLLLKDKKGTPRQHMRRILFKKNGTVRPSFARWYNGLLARRVTSNQEPMEYAAFLRKQMESGALATASTLHIVTTPHTEFIGEAIAASLQNTRLRVTRATDMPDGFGHDLYAVVAPQMFERLPPPDKRILVQMEQVSASHWVNGDYLARMRESLAVIDYSRENISALVGRGLPLKQIYYVPIRPLRRAGKLKEERDIDVLFYGAISSERRRRYINALAERVNLRVESDTFGPAMRDILDRTKIVVNVHFYENALLETTRLSEALSHGAQIVSEDSTDQADHSDFVGLVDFVPRDDVEAFIRKVEAVLAGWRAPIELPKDEGFSGMSFHVQRVLHGIGVLSLDELQRACAEMEMPSERLILSLPEQFKRYDFALANRLPGAVLFHGLRNIDGWKGCASSYKFLSSHALARGLSRLTIYEDDATFVPDAVKRLTAIEQELTARGDDWDIFSGLLSDLHTDASITGINIIRDEEFIDLDSVIGMVFGIYNRSALKTLADFSFDGDDSAKHTIDRYLERLPLRTVTVHPPLVGHAETFESTLWPVNNASMIPMIDASIARLGEKRKRFLRQRGRNDL